MTNRDSKHVMLSFRTHPGWVILMLRALPSKWKVTPSSRYIRLYSKSTFTPMKIKITLKKINIFGTSSKQTQGATMDEGEILVILPISRIYLYENIILK